MLLLASMLALGPAAEFDTQPTDEVPQIAYGEIVESCGFAPVPGFGGCTALLIHPEVILIAGHCVDGGSPDNARFSDTFNNMDQQLVALDGCVLHPDFSYPDNFDEANDLAICMLAEPLTDIPFIPPAVGCETDALGEGSMVTMVGRGETEPPDESGPKRWAVNEVQIVTEGTIVTRSGNGTMACPGDSGGPLMIRMEDGSWRSVGVLSTKSLGECGDVNGHNTWARVENNLAWIEEASGRDVTPCHDADGSWAPTEACAGFYAGDHSSAGTWAQWCAEIPTTGPVSSCGPAFDEEPDLTPPAVTITEPSPGAVDATFTVTLDASDEWGVEEVTLQIADNLTAKVNPPYSWEVTLPDGEHLIEGFATDPFGNVGYAESVTVVIGDVGDGDGDDGGDGDGDGDESEGEDEDGGETSGETGGGEETGDDPSLDADEGGCACRAESSDAGSAWLVLAVFGLGYRRRPRRSGA